MSTNVFNNNYSNTIDIYAMMYGINRRAGETDYQLGSRVRAILEWHTKSTHFQRLCYLLLKLGIKSAKWHLPAGVSV